MFEMFRKDIFGEPLNEYAQTWRRRSSDGKRWEYMQAPVTDQDWDNAQR